MFFFVCLSYAHDHKLHNGRCYNYWCPKLTSELTKVPNYEKKHNKWMAASGPMQDIGCVTEVKNSNSAICMKKTIH